MSEATPISVQPVRRAKSMLWRLVLLIPALTGAVYGFVAYKSVPAGGTVTSIDVRFKSDLSGQTRAAVDSNTFGMPDYYLILKLRNGNNVRLPTKRDKVVGSELTWTLEVPRPLPEISVIEVWDEKVLKDAQIDRISVNNTWAGQGQTFAITLEGRHPAPPPWALPLLVAGATLGGIVLLKFVWDQAI